MNKKLNAVLILALCVTCVLTMSCQGMINTAEGQDEVIPAITTEQTPGIGGDDSAPTSSITIGNPGLDIGTIGSVYLLLPQTDDNLKLITDDVVTSAFTTTNDLTENTTESTIPGVGEFRLGPNGELVIDFKQQTLWNNETCQLLYSRNSEEYCIQDEVFSLKEKVQFDAAGNVFFHGWSGTEGQEKLIRWDANSHTKSELIFAPNITLRHWLPHANGTIYLSGSTNNIAFFKAINPADGTTTDLLPEDSEVDRFTFIDGTHLIVQSQNIYYNASYQSGNFLYDVSTQTITQRLDTDGSDLSTIQIDSQNHVYVLNDETIQMIYPGTPFTVETNLEKTSLFKIYNNTLYAAGKKDDDQQLVALNLSTANATPQIILLNSEIYHLEYDNQTLYLDVLSFENNAFALVSIDLQNDTIKEVQSLNEKLWQLQSVYSVQNFSFQTRIFDETPNQTQVLLQSQEKKMETPSRSTRTRLTVY